MQPERSKVSKCRGKKQEKTNCASDCNTSTAVVGAAFGGVLCSMTPQGRRYSWQLGLLRDR